MEEGAGLMLMLSLSSRVCVCGTDRINPGSEQAKAGLARVERVMRGEDEAASDSANEDEVDYEEGGLDAEQEAILVGDVD